MNKRHYQNLMSKEKKIYESNVKKFKKLLQSNEKGKMHLEHVQTISDHFESTISDPLASTSTCGVLPSTDIHAILQQIVGKLDELDKRLDTIEQNQQFLSNGQAAIVTNQEAISKKLEQIDKNLKLKPEMMAQNKALMECKVSINRIEKSVRRITGETHDAKVDEVAAMLPLRCVDSVKEMEDKLEAEDFAQAMVIYMHKLKGTSEDVSSVIRGIFTDDLLHMYNWQGRWERHSFEKLSICNKLLRDVFQEQPALDFEKGVKKAIERSHHRIKQKRYLKKEK